MSNLSTTNRVGGLSSDEVPVDLDRRTAVYLRQLDRQTLRRLADIQAEAITTAAKFREIDHLAQVAMFGQAMLSRVREAMAAGDPFLLDELRVYGDVARIGKVETLADFVHRMRRR